MSEYSLFLSLLMEVGALTVLYLAADLCFLCPLHHRTLLALGCHIAHVNPAAEDDLKKVKLPKK